MTQRDEEHATQRPGAGIWTSDQLGVTADVSALTPIGRFVS